jgi:ribosomal protein L20
LYFKLSGLFRPGVVLKNFIHAKSNQQPGQSRPPEKNHVSRPRLLWAPVLKFTPSQKTPLKKAGSMHSVTGSSKNAPYRRLWIARINAATRAQGMNYSRFIHALGEKGIGLNRKALADLALNHPATFKAVLDAVKARG